MKSFYIFVIITFGVCMAAPAGEYLLVPQPRLINYGQGYCRFEASEICEAISNAQSGCVSVEISKEKICNEQGYELAVTKDKVIITAGGAAGVYYAKQTLKQICVQEKVRLRCLKIEDRPDFEMRGVMLDISRDKVPTMETLYELVDLLSSLKYNQFQLYTEHTFAYSEHKTVWENASPMTAEQIRQLQAYCRERFIELVPNQNSFGHMERWLSNEKYRHLAEAPDGCETEYGWRGPFGLCAIDPCSIEFLQGLYDELLPNFESKYFNVGCDETFDLGLGRSKEACDQRGKGVVYLDFVKKIRGMAGQHNKQIMIWGDIVRKHPELWGEIPKDIIILEWGYEAGHEYAKRCERIAETGLEFYVCPGTSSWLSVLGRFDNMKANQLNAATNGKKYGAKGFLVTNWGDAGHWQPLPVCWPGYVHGAGVSWCLESNKDMDIAAVLDEFVLKDKAKAAGKVICDLGNIYLQPDIYVRNSSILVRMMLSPDAKFEDNFLAELNEDKLNRTIAYIDDVSANIDDTKMQRSDAELIVEELKLGVRILRHACKYGIARLGAENKKSANIPSEKKRVLAAELEDIMRDFRKLWVVRNRVGGLDDSVGRMKGFLEEVYK